MQLDDNNKAWQIITEEEKTALSLQFSYDKSTWQAGEIMGKAHYKYLEIKARAEKFLKMFTEYFEIFKGLIPNGIVLDPRFKNYLELVILSRKTTFEAIDIIKDKEFSSTTYREELIRKEFEKLQAIKDYGASALLNIILDFDRWNNFRILPKFLQEPSAYKRRNKNRLKKQIKTIVNISPFIIEQICKKFSTTKPNIQEGFIPLVSKDKYVIVRIDLSGKKENIDQINKLGLFIFKNFDKTKEFAELLLSFDITSIKDCKQGLVFWPQYRVYIQGAINYTIVENIIPSRKYLDNLLNEWDLKAVRNLKAKSHEE